MAISLTRGTGLVLALLLSLLLHFVLLSLWPSPRVGPRPPAQAAERSLSLSLAVAGPRATAPDTNRAQRSEAPAPRERFREGGAARAGRAPEPRPDAVLPRSAPEPRPDAVLPRSAPEPAPEPPLGRARDLDLRLPDPAPAPGPAPAPLSTGVFDPELARRLSDLRRQAERAPRTALSRSWLNESRWLGGRLETFVNIGGRCFNVIAADPLDSLSFEQWFPVKCPR